MARRRAVALFALTAIALSACHHRPRPVVAAPPLRYVLEPAWQANGVWHYPQEHFVLDETGLATTDAPGHAPLTSDNEPYDPTAMAAAMADIQLPAIATVTNLDTGAAVLLRINDRGPQDPGRVLSLTQAAARLLGIAGPTRVRIRLDPDLSAALAHQVQGHAADLALTAAPRGDVQQATLAPLTGAGQEQGRTAAGTLTVAQAGDAPTVTVPTRLPPTLMQGAPDPGPLMIDAGTFNYDSAARRRLADLRDLGARLLRVRAGGQTRLLVRLGPYDSVAQADAALSQVIAAGVPDPRIIVDTP